jgi:hypothetical protein
MWPAEQEDAGQGIGMVMLAHNECQDIHKESLSRNCTLGHVQSSPCGVGLDENLLLSTSTGTDPAKECLNELPCWPV